MKTSTQKRIARLSGLLLLALLVVALNVTAAQAMLVVSAGTGGSSTSAVSGTSNAAQRQIGSAWGYYYYDAATINALQLPTLAQVQQHHGAVPSTSAGSGASNAAQLPTLAQLQHVHNGPNAPSVVSGGGTVNAAQPASSGISSTTVWIVAGAVLGTLLIGTWALARRRRKQREEAPACELSVAGC